MKKSKRAVDVSKTYERIEAQLIDNVDKTTAVTVDEFKIHIEKLLDEASAAFERITMQSLDGAVSEGAKKGISKLNNIFNGRAFTAKDLAAAKGNKQTQIAASLATFQAEKYKDKKIFRGAYIELKKGLIGARNGAFLNVNKKLKELAVTGDNTVFSAQIAIKQTFEDDGVFKVKFANGAKVSYTSYANMVARTARIESANAVYQKAGGDMGTNLFECVGNSVTCAVCSQFQNRIYCSDGKDKRFPALYKGDNAPLKDGYMTIHPNCRCEFIPWFEKMQTPEELRRAIEKSNRPFEDSRTMEQKRQYSAWQATNRKIYVENCEFAEMTQVLGKEMPYKTISGFRIAKRHYDKGIKDGSIDKTEAVEYNNYAIAKRKLADSNKRAEIRKYQPKAIEEGKQGKHIREHNNFQEGKSYLTVSLEEAQELVNKYAGTGEIKRSENGRWVHKERIITNKIIGVYVNKNEGIIQDTNAFMIHYSKNGTHIVPAKGNKR